MPTWSSGEPCSKVSATLGETLGGTAPQGKAWIALEHIGPWTARVFDIGSPEWLRNLATRAAAAHVGVLLIRKPGRRREPKSQIPRVLIATTLPDVSGLERVVLDRPEELLDLDLDALAAGVLPGWGEPQNSNSLLICTNGKRDRCCAIAGRSLALQLHVQRPDHVWECTHLGGHRFAPTGLLLPSGYAYGRLTFTEALSLIDAPRATFSHLSKCRGRSTWDALGQAAELTVRGRRRTLDANILKVLEGSADDEHRIVESAADGTRTTVTFARAQATVARPMSCGAEPAKPPTVSAVDVSA
jgi:hypothetical protein